MKRKTYMKGLNWVTALVLLAGTSLVSAQGITSKISASDYDYLIENGTVTLTGYHGAGGDVIVPSSIAGYPVVTLVGTFRGVGNVTNVVIPGSVQDIDQQSFFGCTNLLSISLTNGVTKIGLQAFQGCSSLGQISIPSSVSLIQAGVFNNCTALTNLVIAGGVTDIGVFNGGMLGGNGNLKSLTFPASVTSLSVYEFAGCTNLTGVFFKGNAPQLALGNFIFTNHITFYYLAGTTGWSNTCGAIPAVLWNPQITSLNRTNLTVSGNSNLPVVVEVATNLPMGNWAPCWSGNLTNGWQQINAANQPDTGLRFYRLRSP